MNSRIGTGFRLIRIVWHELFAEAAKCYNAPCGETNYMTLTDYDKFWSPAFDMMESSVSLMDCDHNIVRANKGFFKFTSPPECPYRRMLLSGKFESGEFFDPNTKKWLSVNVTPIFGEGHKCIGAIHIATDITKKRNTEENLKKEQEKFKAVVELAQDIIFVKDAHGRYTTMNPAGAALLGMAPLEIIGKTDFELFGAKVGREIQKIDKEVMEKEMPCTYERLRAYNGEKRYFHTTKVPYFSSDGKVIGLIGISRDMTEQRKTTQMVEFYREYAENIVLHLPLSLLVINRKLCINFANQHFLSRMRMGREDIIEKSLDVVFSKAIIKTTTLDKKIMEVIKGASDVVKDRFISRGRCYDYMITPLKEQTGKRRNALLVMEDITESVVMEDNLLHSEKLAAIGKFTAAVAHEINNPLSVVVGNIQYLLSNIHDVNLCNEKEIKNLEEMLMIANNEARRCADIVRNLLHFSHKGGAKNTEIDINRTIKQMMQMLAPQIKLSKMKTRLDFADKLPPVLGNADRLQQVFVNLVLNAQQAMKDGGKLTIKTALDGGHVVASFRDTGPGIPKKYLHRIFEPFYSTKEAGKGTGLGLFIVHSIMQDHHGVIEVQSKRGFGATFNLKFPAVKKKGWFGF